MSRADRAALIVPLAVGAAVARAGELGLTADGPATAGQLRRLYDRAVQEAHAARWTLPRRPDRARALDTVAEALELAADAVQRRTASSNETAFLLADRALEVLGAENPYRFSLRRWPVVEVLEDGLTRDEVAIALAWHIRKGWDAGDLAIFDDIQQIRIEA